MSSSLNVFSPLIFHWKCLGSIAISCHLDIFHYSNIFLDDHFVIIIFIFILFNLFCIFRDLFVCLHSFIIYLLLNIYQSHLLISVLHKLCTFTNLFTTDLSFFKIHSLFSPHSSSSQACCVNT